MPAVRLRPRRVEKPWGRCDLGPPFGQVPDPAAPVGEIWFEGGAGGLLVKYLFTGEKLSVQVHPDDDAARALGLPHGKSEAWVILDAEPRAQVAIGTRHVLTADELREAALDGRIESLIDWRTVRAGDVMSSPGGTIHALGPGLRLIEIQQDLDVTYRLYDYGRDRGLDIDDAVRVARPVPFVYTDRSKELEPGRSRIVNGPAFVLERWIGARRAEISASADRPVWLIPVAGASRVGGDIMEPGTVWLATAPAFVEADGGADLLLAVPGTEPLPVA